MQPLPRGAIVIDGYRVIGTGAVGASAEVLHCQEISTGQEVAIKIAHSDELRPGARRRFESEALLLGAIRHPGVARVFSSGQLPDGRPYIVMEWLGKHSLASETRVRGRLAERDACSILRQIAEGLRALHEVGVVHRDLKKQNVMVLRGDPQRVVLVDLGIAKDLTRQFGGVTTSVILGSPSVMAPEQILAAEVTSSADIYALGALSYELVTGVPPFTAPSVPELEELHLSATPRLVGELADVSLGFQVFVARCLRKDPAHRFPDAQSIVAALDCLAEEVTIQVRWSRLDELDDATLARVDSAQVAIHLLASQFGLATSMDAVEQTVFRCPRHSAPLVCALVTSIAAPLGGTVEIHA